MGLTTSDNNDIENTYQLYEAPIDGLRSDDSRAVTRPEVFTTGAQDVERHLGLFVETRVWRRCIWCQLRQPTDKGGSMKSTCRRCGGFVVDEQVLDYYQASRWRCVNCDWYRRETEISSSRAVRLANRGAYR